MLIAILVVVLSLTTMVIAYWSDNLGKKLGKQRISLLGLRPRQTATAITMASSWGIMIMTLLVFLIVVPQFRKALLEYHSLRAKSTELSDKVERYGHELSSLQKSAEQASAQAQTADKQRQAAVKQLALVRDQLHDQQAALDTARKGESNARQAESVARQREGAANSRAATVQVQYNETQTELGRLAAQLEREQGQIRDKQRQLSSVNQQLTTSQANLAQSKSKLAQLRSILSQTKGVVGEQIKEVRRQSERVHSLQEQQTTLQEQLAQLQSEVDKSQEKIDSLRVQVNTYERVILDPNPQVPLGTLLADQYIPGSTSVAEVRSLLLDMLQRGTDAAKERYTKNLEVKQRAFHTKSGMVALSESDLPRAIAASDRPVSVRIVANRPHVESEPDIEALIVAMQVNKIFSAGDPIAQPISLELSQSDSDVWHELLKQIDQGEKFAINVKKAAPILPPDDMYIYAPNTRDQMFQALRRIQTMSGVVKVRLLAAKDLTNIDRLQVRYDITPESD